MLVITYPCRNWSWSMLQVKTILWVCCFIHETGYLCVRAIGLATTLCDSLPLQRRAQTWQPCVWVVSSIGDRCQTVADCGEPQTEPSASATLTTRLGKRGVRRKYVSYWKSNGLKMQLSCFDWFLYGYCNYVLNKAFANANKNSWKSQPWLIFGFKGTVQGPKYSGENGPESPARIIAVDNLDSHYHVAKRKSPADIILNMLYEDIYIYIHIYIYVCVCVYICVFIFSTYAKYLLKLAESERTHKKWTSENPCALSAQ